MAPQIADILKDSEFKPELVERIAVREYPAALEVVAPNPAWPEIFDSLKKRIVDALGANAVAVNHVGSTSVPGLPAKDCIDIDLVVSDVANETAYVGPLEAAGFRFLLREAHWYGHRFFYAYNPHAVNLHVWGPESPEVTRHQIFRNRLLSSPEDMAAYLAAKKLASRQTQESGGNLQEYNSRKEDTIRQILRNAFVELGYISKA
ncbi:UPF0157-domain-containing protein [Aureobasidium subglaciale]|nr:UPF0157-domain-containing protein [Aureobasidium subglaciale]